MANPKKLEYTALVGLVLQAIFALTCWVLSVQSGSRAVTAEMWHLAVGLVVWAAVLVHGRQRRLAREEREELEQLKETRLSEEIFEETELDTMRASRALLIFERYAIPVITVALSAGLLFLAYRVLSAAFASAALTVAQPVVVAVGMVFIAFGGFLIGKYSAGLAQSPRFRLLRAAGGYVLGNVIACVLIAISMALYHFDVTWGETVVTYAIPAIMSLVGVELLLNLVLDIYRPRVPGQERRPPYDSRLLGLFAEPGGVLKTVASTLDYQFGFKVSETWFYRFMERAIVPLVLIQLLALWLLSALVVVDPYEVAFVETLGTPYVSKADAARGLPASVFQPGFHLKWPWPFAVTRTVPAYKVQSVDVGKIYYPEESQHMAKGIATMEDPDVILWRERHIDPAIGFEANFLVPSMAATQEEQKDIPEESVVKKVEELAEEQAAEVLPVSEAVAEAPEVNLARVVGEIHFRVRQKADGMVDEKAVFQYTYQQADTEEHLRKLAFRALCRIAATQDFIKWIAQERGETVERFEQMVRRAVAEKDLGVEVIFVGIAAVHPPPDTAGAYEDVVTALEEKHSAVLAGEIAQAQMVQGAKAHKAERVSQAEGYSAKTLANAEAEKDQFLVQLQAYKKAPMVYRFRRYFENVERALSDQKIYVVPVTASEVDIIDMQERLRPQLLDLDVAEE